MNNTDEIRDIMNSVAITRSSLNDALNEIDMIMKYPSEESSNEAFHVITLLLRRLRTLNNMDISVMCDDALED